MSQSDVMSFLKKESPRKFTSREVAEALEGSRSSTIHNLGRLVKFNLIKREEGNESEGKVVYWCEK